MFGYIKPYLPELKLREYELYNAVYCGLCKSMGRATRFYSRMTLSYDAVFLCLVLSSLRGEPFKTYKGRCGLNPFRKKLIAEDNGILRYGAAVSAELSYYSVLDNIKDDRGVKRLGSRMLLPACRKMKKKAKEVFTFDTAFTEEKLDELHKLEEERSGELDRACDIFGSLLSYYISAYAPEEKKEAAANIGSYTGKYIYAADACDDYKKDEKSGAYNPLKYGDGDIDTRLTSAFGAMSVWADRASCELMLEGRDGAAADIAQNIMKLGMIDTAKKVTADKNGRKRRK